nr:hypothetical protein [Shigella flexneri]
MIPRSPGGEITPEGLMAVGRIARKFNLYTKSPAPSAWRCLAHRKTICRKSGVS